MTTTPTSGIELSAVHKSFDEHRVLSEISFNVGGGEVVAITGPSGSGKSTICRLISGVEAVTAGDIRIHGDLVNDQPARYRRVAHMFESFALYPNMTVEQNVAFPLRSPRGKKLADAEVVTKVREVLEMTEILHLRERLPGQLSGGQKQRVALCRALVQDARAFVLDEPVSHLDAKLRHRLHGDIRRRLKASGQPSIWCTPDAMDALAVADRIVVLLKGEVVQVATPDELFRRPASVKVAALVGDPPINLLPGRLVDGPDGTEVEIDGKRLYVQSGTAAALRSMLPSPELVVGIPPTAISLQDSATRGFPARAYTWEPFGKYVILTASVGESFIKIKSKEIAETAPEEQIHLGFDASAFLFFDKEKGMRLQTPALVQADAV